MELGLSSNGIGFGGNLFIYDSVEIWNFGVVCGFVGNCALRGFGYKKRRKYFVEFMLNQIDYKSITKNSEKMIEINKMGQNLGNFMKLEIYFVVLFKKIKNLPVENNILS